MPTRNVQLHFSPEVKGVGKAPLIHGKGKSNLSQEGISVEVNVLLRSKAKHVSSRQGLLAGVRAWENALWWKKTQWVWGRV